MARSRYRPDLRMNVEKYTVESYELSRDVPSVKNCIGFLPPKAAFCATFGPSPNPVTDVAAPPVPPRHN